MICPLMNTADAGVYPQITQWLRQATRPEDQSLQKKLASEKAAAKDKTHNKKNRGDRNYFSNFKR